MLDRELYVAEKERQRLDCACSYRRAASQLREARPNPRLRLRAFAGRCLIWAGYAVAQIGHASLSAGQALLGAKT
jgi:hypothetical protein